VETTLIINKLKVQSKPLYVQEASTAKLFVTPSHGSPNLSIDTPILQLFDPMQACKSSN
jgi:hypothetical protein